VNGSNDKIITHYTKDGLLDRILGKLAASGISVDALTSADLKPVDEFHIGGVEATDDLLDQLEIGTVTQMLDIGSGIGGTARHIVAHHGAQVTGLDLTPEFVDAARRLTELVGLTATFQVGSALDMPFANDQFDLATLIHVGMNLPDKPKLFSEAARVLRPGGSFAIYDVMRLGDEHPAFPLPWASAPEASFLATPKTYLDAASTAGFTLTARRNRGDFARDFFARFSASLAVSGPQPLSIGLLMGADASTKVGNMITSIGTGHIAPVEMIFNNFG
jgi:SAM-dependent methyltransferase